MLRELVGVAERFRSEGMLPPGYKDKAFRWVVDVDAEGHADLLGPYDRRDLAPRRAPDRQHSGKASEANLKPFLLNGDARYTLRVAEPGREAEARLLHRGFVDLLDRACNATHDPTLEPILRFLRAGPPEEITKHVGPRDLVIFRQEGQFPTERDAVQRFWAEYVLEETLSREIGACCLCGTTAAIVQTLPQEVVIMGQKCQITSFNRTAFEHHGKRQTTNAPMCPACASATISALQHLLSTDNHNAVLVRDPRPGASPLRNQLAIFWLKHRVEVAVDGENWDYEDALAGLTSWEPSLGDTADTEYEALDRLDRLLRVPWHAQTHALRFEENTFHLAVLSANKGRLAVREWLAAPLAAVCDNLAVFLDAQRIVSPDGGAARPLPVPQLLAALGLSSAHDTRGLLRTAYLGTPPMPGLLQAALGRLRSPKNRNNPEVAHALTALVKLVRSHRTAEAKNMEALDQMNRRPAYLAGRLLAVLEAAQRRSTTARLSTTVADRFYGGAATAPAATLGWIVTRAQPAYFAKLRRDGRGRDLDRLMEEIHAAVQAAGGFPQTCSLEDQADFHLGFYCQRAALRPGRPQ